MTNLATRTSARAERDYSPVCWTEYFDEAHDIDLDDPNDKSPKGNSFRIYLKNFQQPYAPKRDYGQEFDSTKFEITQSEITKYSNVPTLVALHGGGYSALTWAQFARHICQICHCRILAIDLRGHGDSKTVDDEQMDIDTLVSDVISVTQATHRICGFPETPRVVLIGHSMGGAIAIKCSINCTESLPSLAGIVIIDVVEGTAKDALPLMMSVIQIRPKKFPTLSSAIEWCVRSGMAKNVNAARVSMPGNLVNIANGQLSIHDVPMDKNLSRIFKPLKQHKFHVMLDLSDDNQPTVGQLPRLPLPQRLKALKSDSSHNFRPPLQLYKSPDDSSIIEETGDESPGDARLRTQNQGYKRPFEVEKSGYSWRTDLGKTQPYWNGWFDGLSTQLLDAVVQGKFLLLAGIDRLDKTLTIGHMQGKFMMKVLPKCGHAVHEDLPDQVAKAIGDFLIRNKFATAID